MPFFNERGAIVLTGSGRFALDKFVKVPAPLLDEIEVVERGETVRPFNIGHAELS